jgi:glycosyltransferase involved in cell wall biosynthesis
MARDMNVSQELEMDSCPKYPNQKSHELQFTAITSIPLVTVIIPVYNRLKYLPQAVGSVLEQTHRRIEVIVVDDGSEMDPAHVLSPFGSRVVLVRKPNGGPASARNCGIGWARGEFLLFLDDDDFLEPTALEVLLETINKHPSAAWAAGRFAFVGQFGQHLARQHRCYFTSGNIYPRMILQNLVGAPSVVLVRAEAIREVGGFDDDHALVFAEDYDLWLTLARKSPIAATTEIVSNYRVYDGQATKNFSRHYDAWLRVLQKHRAVASPDCVPVFQQSIARLHLAYGDELYVAGVHPQARQHWDLALHHHSSITRLRMLMRYAKSYLPPFLLDPARFVARGCRWFLSARSPFGRSGPTRDSSPETAGSLACRSDEDQSTTGAIVSALLNNVRSPSAAGAPAGSAWSQAADSHGDGPGAMSLL